MKKSVYIIVTIILVALAILGFGVYSYLTPDIAIHISKPQNSDSQRYCEQVSVSVSEKFGLPLPQGTRDNLNEWTTVTTQAMEKMRQITEPCHIEADVRVENGKTIVTFSGEIYEGDKTTDYLNELTFDFVLTEDIS